MDLLAPHTCSRDACPAINVSGQKIRCFVCSKIYFGKCFGIDDTIYDACAPRCPFDDKSNIQFICSICLNNPKTSANVSEKNEPIELNQPIQPAIMNELAEIKTKLNDLHKLGVDTNEKCRNFDSKSIHRKPRQSFAEVVRTNGSSSPNINRASKRSRADTSHTQIVKDYASSTDKPKPKSGTRDIVIGPGKPQIGSSTTVMPQVDGTDWRSIWVSRFHPDTSIDEVLNHIKDAITYIDVSNLKCRKLVKKDADLSKLKFVSFKIDADSGYFDELCNPDIWPAYVRVREFFDNGKRKIELNPTSFVQFPSMNGNSSLIDQIDPELIDLTQVESAIPLVPQSKNE